MKQGLSLENFIGTMKEQRNQIRDLIVNTSVMRMMPDGCLTVENTARNALEILDVTNNFHSQLATRLKIPKAYYDRCLREGDVLLSNQVNHWLERKPEKRMIRLLGKSARAYLSDSYRILDNYDLFANIIPILKRHDFKVASCDILPNRMYLKIFFPELTHDITESTREGDIVKGGIVISNSEVGDGSLRIEPFLFFLACSNGMIGNSIIRKYHVGRKHELEESVKELLSDETVAAQDKAFWMKVTDLLKAAIDIDIFENQINTIIDTTQRQIEADPREVVEIVAQKNRLTDAQGEHIFASLLKDNDMTQYGLGNAVTAVASFQDGYEEATSLERLGGDILALDGSDWISLAA